jgi:hypothetical protein
MFAPATRTLTNLIVLRALKALKSLLILVNRSSLLDLTVLALFIRLNILYRKLEKRETMTIEKSNLKIFLFILHIPTILEVF